MSAEEVFWYWIAERHAIYLRRAAGAPAPWTEDEILRKYRFTNVFRELDRITVWIKNNWRDKHSNHPNLWFAMCVARQLNLPSTLEKIGFPRGNKHRWLDSAYNTFRDMKKNGERIYGPAYVITAGGRTLEKYKYTVQCLRELASARPVHERGMSLEEMHKSLIRFPGIGGFIGYEIVSDLRWTRYYDGRDHMSWANPGPGAKRGIGRILYGDKKAKVDNKTCIEVMRELLAKSRACLPSHVPYLEMRDIEHSLCEVDKYLRTLHLDGKPKRLFNGGTP